MLKNLKPIFILHAVYISLLGIAIPFTLAELVLGGQSLSATDAMNTLARGSSLNSVKLLEIITPFLTHYLWSFVGSVLVLSLFLFYVVAFTLDTLHHKQSSIRDRVKRTLKVFFFRGFMASMIVLLITFLLGFPSNVSVMFLSLAVVAPIIIMETNLRPFQAVWSALTLSQLKTTNQPRFRVYLFLFSLGIIAFFGVLLGASIKDFFIVGDEAFNIPKADWFPLTYRGLSSGYMVGVSSMHLWHGLLITFWTIVATIYYTIILQGRTRQPSSADGE
ncbi:MAG: hypothetical protein AB7T49_02275 [Oligoflexales bacterium]